MCEYCSRGTEWLVYTTKREFGVMVCSGHLEKAIKEKHEQSESSQIVYSEPVYP